MNTFNPGYVYILNEEDMLTGNKTDYYKIGMTANDRTVKERIDKDHQTGNPRRIIDVHSFRSEAAFLVERHLHKHFAHLRIFREWFKLNFKQLNDIKAEAKRYDGLIGPEAKAVRKDAKKESNGKMITLKANVHKDAEKLKEEALILLNRKLELDLKNTILANELRFETGLYDGGIDGITIMKQKGVGNPIFKFTLFRDSSDKNKKLYEKFCIKASLKGSIKISDNPTKAKNHPQLFEENKKWKTKYDANKPVIGKTKAGSKNRSKSLEKKHLEYLNLVQEIEEVKVEFNIKEFEMMKLLGVNEGVEGLFTWIRTKSYSFDETSFKNAHPNLYSNPLYHDSGKESISITIISARNYD